ncbi:MAG TPA: hypothetical protein VKM55_02520 [Candidatus Lokiarchaeia archaeon]|nr:hypothetical protein [Candidatus Lokiarchaeia archaeon]
MDFPTMKNNHDYYNLKKLALDLKQDLKHMKATGIDPRAFLGGAFEDYVSRVESIIAVEKRHARLS